MEILIWKNKRQINHHSLVGIYNEIYISNLIQVQLIKLCQTHISIKNFIRFFTTTQKFGIYQILILFQKDICYLLPLLHSKFALPLTTEKCYLENSTTPNLRATPNQFLNYKYAILLYNVYNSHQPLQDWLSLNFNQILTRRQNNFEVVKTMNF